ncbi:hypothetical protein BpHYR1_038371 [Brachionus plicatilis]|uniref:Uncharacterized protein n=1 Tax=Brachionus plicatilis TaxID=10195 RepID=A0A3M7R190_BRAPC|nr:hypothetical protein BpHYR1_038371 [Brachionus plicatilis]
MGLLATTHSIPYYYPTLISYNKQYNYQEKIIIDFHDYSTNDFGDLITVFYENLHCSKITETEQEFTKIQNQNISAPNYKETLELEVKNRTYI